MDEKNKIKIPYKEYLGRQIDEALSPLNMWFTGVEHEHPPTPDDAMLHFAEHGAENFSEEFEPILPDDENKKRDEPNIAFTEKK